MIIAIDAASTDVSVAIANGDGSSIDEAAWTSEQRQSAELLPRLLELELQGWIERIEGGRFMRSARTC